LPTENSKHQRKYDEERICKRLRHRGTKQKEKSGAANHTARDALCSFNAHATACGV